MWVEIITTQEVVAVGLRTILERANPPFSIHFGPNEGEPDVVLYDVIKLYLEDGSDLDYWLKHASSTVIAVDRTLKPELSANARDRGVEWSIDLGITAEELAEVLQEAIAGTLDDSPVAQAWEASDWPGQEIGLSGRESDILQRVVLGRTNLEIAEELYLSLNSVKTYVRSAYRKIGVKSRAHAATWATQHGFPTPR